MNRNLKLASGEIHKGEIFNEIRALQNKLEVLAETFRPPNALPPQESKPDRAALVRNILKFGTSRRQFFDPNLFGEPAWDILLELYGAEFRGRAESVSSLCIASGVPSTTALRWIGTLEEKGLLSRKRDPHDARRIFVTLTDTAREAMQQLFSTAESASRRSIVGLFETISA
jgi:DNA-binding MarR family transcriptional regulator